MRRTELNPVEALDLLRRRKSEHFSILCAHLKIAEDDKARKNALYADLSIILTRYNSNKTLHVFKDKRSIERFKVLNKNIKAAANEFERNNVFEWIKFKNNLQTNVIHNFVSQAEKSISDFENEIPGMEPFINSIDPLDDLLKVGLRQIFSVYFILGECDAAFRDSYPKIRNMNNANGKFVTFAKDALNALGIRNSRQGTWTEEAVEKRLKRR